MSKTVILHTYRGGSGTSTLTANLAVLLAMRGARVGVIDADLYTPGLHLLFGITGDALTRSFNVAYLQQEQPIAELAYDATHLLSDRGRLFVVPSSATLPALTRTLKESYDPIQLKQGSQQFIRAFDLDYLLIDTYPGVDTSWITFANQVLLVMRPDQQDFKGTAMLTTALKGFEASVRVILNQVVDRSQIQSLRDQIERAYRIPVAGAFEWMPEMAQIGSSRLFCLQYPEHPFTISMRSLSTQIVSS
ncbi:MinD/ParA family ATP-binding protein [Leptolyngbya sp. AN03gr2]|uniref:MinD/ParA family ATP-binding protein n=1 Tax=unclassified Leptolyngbya TaxID=2650499 RepID=UPI003D31002C